MTVYVDPLFDMRFDDWRKGEWCHMTADTLPELHEMADRIGIKREYFQNKPHHQHYDLRPTMREKAVEYGAIELGRYEYVKTVKKIMEKNNENQ